MIDLNIDLLQRFIIFLIKISDGAATLAKKSEIENEIISNKELAENYTNQLLKNQEKRSKIIFCT